MSAPTTERSDAWHLLNRVRARLDNPQRWIQGEDAATSPPDFSRLLDPRNPAAACWCLSGALDACCKGFDQDYVPALKHLASAIRERGFDIHVQGEVPLIIQFNDAPERTHEDILAVIDRALELAAQEAA